MTDYEPWAGTNLHTAIAAKPLIEARKTLKWLVFRGKTCVGGFPTEEDAKKFRGYRRWQIREIPFFLSPPGY